MKSLYDDLFESSYFKFEMLCKGENISANSVIVYYTENFVENLYWVDIKNDTDFKLYNLFCLYVGPFNQSNLQDICKLALIPSFVVNYHVMLNYNINIRDMLISGDFELEKFGRELFKLELYKEFRKYLIPKFAKQYNALDTECYNIKI